MLMGPRKSVKTLAIAPAAVLLLVVLHFVGACSDDPHDGPGDETEVPTGKTGGGTTPSPQNGRKTTTDLSPPEVTLGQNPGGRPEVVIRLEGDPMTTFTGHCSVGQAQNGLSGRVPERFTFDLAGERLECRIEKRDGHDGDLKVVLVARDTTRSVQQTNSPGGIINLSYKDE
jgi:hypothetical protein